MVIEFLVVCMWMCLLYCIFSVGLYLNICVLRLVSVLVLLSSRLSECIWLLFMCRRVLL